MSLQSGNDHKEIQYVPQKEVHWGIAFAMMLIAAYLPASVILLMLAASYPVNANAQLFVLQFLETPLLPVFLMTSLFGLEEVIYVTLPVFFILLGILASIGRKNWAVLIAIALMLFAMSTVSAQLVIAFGSPSSHRRM